MTQTVTFRPSADDFVAVSRGNFLHSLRRRRFHVRLAVFALIGAGGGFLFDLVTELPLTASSLLIGATAALAWLSLILAVGFLLLPRRARRLFRQQRTLDRDFTFTWNDAGIDFSSDLSRSTLFWRDYHDWFETPVVFGFGLNEQLYHWTPKRAMTVEQVADLRTAAGAARLPG